jgi:hypothetical protein
MTIARTADLAPHTTALIRWPRTNRSGFASK